MKAWCANTKYFGRNGFSYKIYEEEIEDNAKSSHNWYFELTETVEHSFENTEYKNYFTNYETALKWAKHNEMQVKERDGWYSRENDFK